MTFSRRATSSTAAGSLATQSALVGVSNSANIVAAEYILYGPRYAGAVASGFPIDPTVD